uniref:Uncharacterized protein n=1 Tax=Setaria italica TaxID=4555 RepID=K3Y8Z8_SETIT
MASDRGEVDTSRAFRSVKEAVAVFGERILVREAQLRPNGITHGNHRAGREVNLKANVVAVAASDAKLERTDGVRDSVGLQPRESYSKPSVSFNAKQEGSSSNTKTASNELPVPVPRPVSEDVPMYLVPSSPPFFASSPSLANDDDDEQAERKETDLMVMSTIKKLEEEAARTRQEVSQLKWRLAEMELSMATLNAKLHRALSKRGRSGDVALAVWAERRAPSRPQLGHLLRLGGADREAAVMSGGGGGGRTVAVPSRRKVQKQKPIVPLVVPLINGVLFSKKRRMKDKESVYMKELYSLLRLS